MANTEQPKQREGDCLLCGHCAATGQKVAAPQASQPIGQPESLGEWVDVTKRLPERGQRIQGLSRSGAWIETFDPDEPIGHMTHWRAVDDDATDSTEQPDSASRCKHAYTGNSGDGYTCMFCMQPKDSQAVEIDGQPVSGAMTDDQLADIWDESTGNMTIATVRAIRNFANALLSASGQAVSEKDAERYRWLRDKASSQEVERLWWMDSVEEMEAALDSAIANEKANQKGGAA